MYLAIHMLQACLERVVFVNVSQKERAVFVNVFQEDPFLLESVTCSRNTVLLLFKYAKLYFNRNLVFNKSLNIYTKLILSLWH